MENNNNVNENKIKLPVLLEQTFNAIEEKKELINLRNEFLERKMKNKEARGEFIYQLREEALNNFNDIS